MRVRKCLLAEKPDFFADIVLPKMIVFLFILVVLSFLGCATKPKEIIITKNHYLSLPEYFLADCDFPKPPDKNKYLSMKFPDKEKALVNLYLIASELNHKCNIRLSNARKYQNRLKQIYSEERNNAREKDSTSHP